MGKQTHIELTSEQQTALEKLIRIGNALDCTHTRARILLLNDRIQSQKRIDHEDADNVRWRFLSSGLQAALDDKGWSSVLPRFTDDVEAALTMLDCGEPPERAAR